MSTRSQNERGLPARSYKIGEFELDPLEETLSRSGKRLSINRRMFQVLLLLVERSGEIVSKEEFFEKVWKGSFVEDNNLTVTIAALRKTLGDDAKQARFIENIPRKGYRFVAEVDRPYADPSSYPDGSKDDRSFAGVSINRKAEGDPDPRSTSIRARPARSYRLLIGIFSVLLISIFVIAVVGRKLTWPFNIPVVDRIDSIAVLPFESETTDSEYLADGMTDSITGNLSKLAELRVIDRNSAWKYKNRVSDPLAAGRELNVRAVVTGQIEQNGDVLIITAELFDLANNAQVWRQQFRRRSSDLFATQLEISQEIIQKILPGAPVHNQSSTVKRRERDAAAYDLYLRGRYLWNKRTNIDIQRSVELFREAIDRDPTFAKAYIGLADAYTLGDFSDLNISLEEKNAIIRGTIQKALEIDDNLGEAYASLAINKCYYDWDLSGAESDYRRALELSPNDATAHHWYAEFLAMQGRFEESFAEYDRALSLDPLSLPIRTDKALNYFYARDFDTAIELLNKVKDINPDYARTYEFLAWVYREKGMFNDAVDAMERQLDIQLQRGDRSQQSYERSKIYTYNLRNGARNGGSVGFWRAELKYGDPTPFYKATACAKLGDKDEAFRFLEKALKDRYSGMVWLKVMPELDGLRSDARYQDLLRKVGFSD